MPLAPLLTLVTDALLALAAFWLASRLAALSSASGSWPQALWAVALAVGAAAAIAAGSVHAVGPWLGPLALGFLWQCALLGSALAGALLVAGAVLAALRGRARRLALAVLAVLLVVELLLVSRAGSASDAVSVGAANMVLLLALVLLRARTDPTPLGWLILGLALAGAGLAAQAARLTPDPAFDPGAVCRAFLAAALWPIYRTAQGLR